MLKSVSLLARKEGSSHAEFLRHWTDVHATLARRVPQIRRYVQNRFPAGETAGFDGMAELWFDDEAGRTAFRESEAGRAWIADGGNFLNPARCVQLAVVEAAIID